MTHRLTREELYSLVWSEPMKQLAMRFAISDVALAKTCRRAHIPLTERGFWAKQKIGKGRGPEPLPLRFPGMSDEIVVGGGSSWNDWRYSSIEEELRGPLPPPPSFPEEIPVVRERARQMVGKLRGSSTLDQPHPLIARLLEADERRRKKQKNAAYPNSWDNPIFDAPIDRRRLRILNALFRAVERCPCKPSICGREGRELGIQVGQQYVRFTLDLVKARRRTIRRDGKEVNREDKRLRLELQGFDRQKGFGSWEDDGVKTFEPKIEEVGVELIVAGEMSISRIRTAAL